MKALILEDDFGSRVVLQTILMGYGDILIAVNGTDAFDAFRTAHNIGKPYDLICLDIMVPEMSGQSVLRQIREYEKDLGLPLEKTAKIMMVSALTDKENVVTAIRGGCDAYLGKPIEKAKLIGQLKKLKFL